MSWKGTKRPTKSKTSSQKPWKTGKWIWLQGEQILAEEKLQRGISKENSLSSLQFVGSNDDTHLLRKCTEGYKFTKSQKRLMTLCTWMTLNYLSKKWKKKKLTWHLDTNNKNIQPEIEQWNCGIEKCATLIMKTRTRETTEGIELLRQESIRTLREKENYKYLGILEADTMK